MERGLRMDVKSKKLFLNISRYPGFRFAEFVEGSSHLTQEEVMNYSQVSIKI